MIYLRDRREKSLARSEQLKDHLRHYDATLLPIILHIEVQLRESFSILASSTQAQHSELLISCPNCGREFANTPALNAHRRKEHHFAEVTVTTRQQKQVDRFAHARDGFPICAHCGKRSVRWPQLLQHIRAGRCPVVFQRNL